MLLKALHNLSIFRAYKTSVFHVMGPLSSEEPSAHRRERMSRCSKAKAKKGVIELTKPKIDGLGLWKDLSPEGHEVSAFAACDPSPKWNPFNVIITNQNTIINALLPALLD